MKIRIEIEMPETCGKCPFYKESPYTCHNERGMVADCKMGYMDDKDMRDKSFRNKMYPACELSKHAIEE